MNETPELASEWVAEIKPRLAAYDRDESEALELRLP